MQRIKPGVPTHTDFVRTLFSRFIPVASYFKISQLHRLHGLQLVIRSHVFTPAIEILEVEEFDRECHLTNESDAALVMLADSVVGGVA